MFAGALAVPESARWLALRGRPDEAVASLQQGQGLTPESAAAAVAKMQPAGAAPDVLGSVAKLFEVRGRAARAGTPRARERALTAPRAWARVQEGGNRRALTVGVGLVLLQQLSGQACPPCCSPLSRPPRRYRSPRGADDVRRCAESDAGRGAQPSVLYYANRIFERAGLG